MICDNNKKPEHDTLVFYKVNHLVNITMLNL